MRASLIVLTAVLLAPPTLAQPNKPDAQAPRNDPPAVTLTDMERLCTAGRRQACDEAELLRSRLVSAMQNAERTRIGSAEVVDTSRETGRADLSR
jgi:hypothetical protein